MSVWLCSSCMAQIHEQGQENRYFYYANARITKQSFPQRGSCIESLHFLCKTKLAFGCDIIGQSHSVAFVSYRLRHLEWKGLFFLFPPLHLLLLRAGNRQKRKGRKHFPCCGQQSGGGPNCTPRRRSSPCCAMSYRTNLPCKDGRQLATSLHKLS